VIRTYNIVSEAAILLLLFLWFELVDGLLAAFQRPFQGTIHGASRVDVMPLVKSTDDEEI
jgi:hypothetical protein